MAILNRRNIFKIKKPEVVPIQVWIYLFRTKNLKISCDSPFTTHAVPYLLNTHTSYSLNTHNAPYSVNSLIVLYSLNTHNAPYSVNSLIVLYSLNTHNAPYSLIIHCFLLA
jgi:hypothetical protein